MASEQELLDALVKADEEGDSEAAQIFAEEIKKLRAATAPAAAQEITADPKYKALMSVDSSSPEVARMIGQNRNVRQYDEQPEWKKPLIAADDTMRNVADGITFGFADKAAAMLSPGDYDANLAEQRKATQAAADRSGVIPEMAAKIGGGLLTGTAATKAGLTASSIIPQGSGLLQRLLSAAAVGGVEGAGYGALDAAGHDQDISEGATTGLALGAGANTALEGFLSAGGGILSKIRGTNKAPSIDELTAQRKASYKQMEDMGAKFSPQVIKDLADTNNATIRDIPGGARPTNHAATLDKMDEIRSMVPTTPTGKISKKAKPVGMYELDEVRKSVRQDLSDTPNSRFAGKMVRNIDDAMAKADPSKVTSVKGTPEEALDALLRARNLSHREMKAGDLESAMVKADRRVASNATGDTTGNQMRQNIRSILDSDVKASSFNTDELAKLEEVVRGTKTGNLARKVASAANSEWGAYTGSGLGAFIGNAVMPGNPAAIGTGLLGGRLGAKVIGDVAESVSEKSTRKGLQSVIDDITRGRPKVPSRKEVPISEKDRDLATRLLLMMQLQDSIGAKD